MELGFSKDGKLETFKDSDEIHVQIFLYPFYHGNSCKMKIYTKYIFFLFPFNSEEILCKVHIF